MAQKDKLVDVSSGWPTIDPGKMRHVITIQRSGETSPPTYDEAGVVFPWSDFTTAMAAIETVHGADVIKDGQTTTQLALTVAIWYQPGIVGGMRVIGDNGSTYVVRSVENILEMNIALVLNCLALGLNG